MKQISLFAFISLHFATLPLVSLWNDVSETSAENPYWWRVTTQILQCFSWLVIPQGKFASTGQKHYPDLGSDVSSVCNFCTFFSDLSGGIVKCCLFYQAKYLLVYKSNARESSEVVHMHSLAFTFAFWIVGVSAFNCELQTNQSAIFIERKLQPSERQDDLRSMHSIL